MEITLSLPFVLTCAGVLAGLVATWAVQQYKVKSLETELDGIKTRDAKTSPMLAEAVRSISGLCHEILEWKSADHQMIIANEARSRQNRERIVVLEDADRRSLLRKMQDEGIPQQLIDEVEAGSMSSRQRHKTSAAHRSSSG